MKFTRIAAVAAALVGATVLAAPTAGAMDFDPNACLEGSQLQYQGADGQTHGWYRITEPGKRYCNDIYIPYVR